MLKFSPSKSSSSASLNGTYLALVRGWYRTEPTRHEIRTALNGRASSQAPSLKQASFPRPASRASNNVQDDTPDHDYPPQLTFCNVVCSPKLCRSFLYTCIPVP